MTQVWRAWLPWGAAEHPVVRQAVLKAVEDWAGDWFAQSPFSAPEWRFFRDAIPSSSSAAEWVRHGDGVALHLPSGCLPDLVTAALQLHDDPVERSRADREILQAFGGKLAGDLIERLDVQTGASPATGGSIGKGYLELSLSVSGRRQGLRVYVPFSAVIALHRQGQGPSASFTPPPLTPLATALADTLVTVQAFLGTATVSVEDLRNLGPGDTLLLSTPLDGSVAVTAGEQGAPMAHAILSQDGDQTVLLLTR